MTPAGRHVVVGTAGHIDHGKTSLVRALTGIDTDRLPEEKARGITIDLGFAFLEEPDGLVVEIVDVPGHERFVKNMLAGVGGIDVAMLVVAADEGVMPQTREHLAICSLLRVRRGLVALTKADLVEPDWLELVRADVADTVEGTFLDGAPVIAVSARTGAGLDDLRAALRELAGALPPRDPDQLARLAVDRVFSVKGFGTVVTGTLTAGSLRTDERVEVFPKTLEAKVRGLQVHGRPVEVALAGQRTAVNLQGLERALLHRGDVVGRPGTLVATSLLDATVELLADAPRALESRARVRLHVGTSEVMARLLLLDRAEVAPGDATVARLRLEAPVVALPGDRYVLRSYSPVVTIGGGTLLDVAPPRFRRKAPMLLAHLRVLAEGAPEDVLAAHVRHSGASGARLAALSGRVPFGPERLRALVARLEAEGRLFAVDRDWYLHVDEHARLTSVLEATLGAYHQSHPLRSGMPREELRGRVGGVDERVFAALVASLEAAGRVRMERDKVRLAAHEVRLTPAQHAAVETVERAFREAAAAPPSAEEALTRAGLSGGEEHELFQSLVEGRRLVRVKEALFFHAAALEAIEAQVVELLRARKEIGPGDIKDLLGISRKYAIPLLEYLDTRRVTARVGERRVLRGSPGAG